MAGKRKGQGGEKNDMERGAFFGQETRTVVM
jgi:hypothetical protein